jgi:hypothetical protein
LRAVWLHQLLYSQDQTWDLVTIANWSVVEINTAIIVACLPTLKPVLRKVLSPLAHRFIPGRSLPPASDSQPRTIGSMPMNALNMRRKQDPHFMSLEESHIDCVDKGASSVSQVETDQGDSRHEGFDLGTGSKGDSLAVATATTTEIGVPSPAHIKS